MPQVRILYRSPVDGLPGEPRETDRVNVTYSSRDVSPRTVFLAAASYRPATVDEVKVNPRISRYPKDQVAQDAELQAIGEDIRTAQAARPLTFEVP